MNAFVIDNIDEALGVGFALGLLAGAVLLLATHRPCECDEQPLYLPLAPPRRPQRTQTQRRKAK